MTHDRTAANWLVWSTVAIAVAMSVAVMIKAYQCVGEM